MAAGAAASATGRGRAVIRAMRPADLCAVVELDARVFGASRAAYFERRLAALEPPSPASHIIGLVAEEDGAVAGFVMGTLTSGEFGFTDVTALVDSIAVHPGQRRQRIGRALAGAFFTECAARGARDAYTLVNWNAWDMLRFFDSIGFSLAQAVPLRRRLDSPEGRPHEPA
ncbi:MAG TPA: GNAT family N-acetyltransferase [Ktedonobacterales bacterium]